VDYLQQFVTEWYEYQGYFVHRDLWVGLEPDGSYECELDVVAFHPLHRCVVQIEPSMDLLGWKDREQHFGLKFEAGRKYLHRMFGAEPRIHLEQIALIVTTEEAPCTIAGGKIVRLPDLLTEILATVRSFDMSEVLVPEQWPILRTLQLVAAFAGQAGPAPARSSDSRPDHPMSRRP
jgi:hypothetical protein